VEIILQQLLSGQLNEGGEIRMTYSTHDLGPRTYKKIGWKTSREERAICKWGCTMKRTSTEGLE